MSEIVNSSHETAARKQSSTEDNEHDACVLCCKEVEIFSIGECDHPICSECSTRLRVLCEQNECPICRQVLSKVIFTYDKLPYRELEAKNRSGYYSKKYKIGFYSAKIQQAFFNLLDHPCPICNVPPFRRFSDLEYHVRKEHDLHYCDLCIEHLKIFTFERRCYTQAELGLHRTKGDRDNRSHRGHPLCEFCKKRYLDRDELFRHKRRDHYFCHFCDDESNDFYRDYDALANHFRERHFLCEEGRCATEQFIGAFRTEIDYKAHYASAHGRNLNKQESKKTRTVQLEITLGRPARPGLADGGLTNVRSRVPEENYPDPSEAFSSQGAHQRSITIDRSNEEDFPLLGGSSGGPSVSLVPAPFVRLRSATSGLARTRENFPALGAGGGGESSTQSHQSAPPISTVLRKAPAVSTGAVSRTSGGGNAGPGGSMVLHVSNRPTTNGAHNSGAVAKKANALDFPALPSSSKSKKNASRTPIDEDMLPSGAHIPLSNVAAKHRTLVDDYVSVANPNSFQKIQTVQKEELEAKNRKAAEQANAPKLTSQDFPSLGGSAASKSGQALPNNWAKGPKQSDKKQRELENRKAKVAPTPVLPKENQKQTANATNKKQTPPAVSNCKTSAAAMVQNASKKEKKSKDKKDKTAIENNNQLQKLNGKGKDKSSNESPKRGNRSTSPSLSLVNGKEDSLQMRPPPGFGNQSACAQPPPGFQSTDVKVNSIAKSPNNLTFTNSFGERYSIVRTHPYIQPIDAAIRNQKLVSHFQDALKSPEAMEEFRQISQKFREGVYKTLPYYEHCQAALKEKFDDIFPELLVLLPDINKQQELCLVHSQYLNKLSPDKRKQVQKLEVCALCKQVLLPSDSESHRKQHEVKENFPTLGNDRGSSLVKSAAAAYTNQPKCVEKELATLVTDIAKELNVDIVLPRRANRQNFRANYRASNAEDYYRKAIFIPLLDDILLVADHLTNTLPNMACSELQTKIDQWLKWDQCEKTRAEIQTLVKSASWRQLGDILLNRLEFGTAGLRGRMQAGFNGMNELVVVQTAQGLAKYMMKQFSEDDRTNRGIVFGYDGRNNSKRFAELSSNIFIRAGFRVYLFRKMVITPMVPFTIRLFNCLGGVMVTASHNPKDDNGYKVYWANSAQIVPPHDKQIHMSILQCLEPWLDSFDTRGLYICTCLMTDPKDAIAAYIQRIAADVPQKFVDLNSRSDLRFVYTAMHGVGYPFVEKLFAAVKIKPVIFVREQNEPDPEFPTVPYPNPEEGKSALDMAISLAEREGVTHIIANDPDADRFALATKTPRTRSWKIYTGNEIGALLGWWAMFLYKQKNPNSDLRNCWMISSTVSSKILRTIGRKEDFNFVETLTGFKWMANEADRLMKNGKTVLFSFEESIGFMFGTNVLDKDGVSAACQVVTMANYLKTVEGISLNEKLDKIYKEYGFHYNNASYYFCYEPPVIKKIFERLRNFSAGEKTYPTSILGGKYKMKYVRDLTNGVDTEQPDGNAVLPVSASSQMITFTFENGLVITLRTSGTEPKIKYYAEMCAQPGQSDFDGLINTTDKIVSAIIEEFLQPAANNLKPKAD